MAQPYPEAFPPELWDAAIAATRFGYGASPGVLPRIAADPRGWLLSQLEGPATGPHLSGLPAGSERAAAFLAARAAGGAALNAFRYEIADGVAVEERAHIAHAVSTDAPFRERLVRFWANHFSLSSRTLIGFAASHAFEREVVRPLIGGSFVRLLTEAVRHPAMLLYLDNAGSIGPYSPAGLKGAAWTNDLMARQILTNLTRGAQAEMNAKDVSSLTRMLTGWSVAGPAEEDGGAFRYRDDWHEPNPKLFLNRNYPQAGMLEAEAALDTLGRRPEVAYALAAKMARYFVADDPPADLIEAMVSGFAEGGNSLTGMARGMVLSPAAFAPVQAKAKTPEDLVFSSFRALNLGADQAPLALRAIRALGQAPKGGPLAGGWPDSMAAWLSPSQLAERLEWGGLLARRHAPGGDGAAVSDLALGLLGPLLNPATHRRLTVTGRPAEALALFFAAPEFQKR